MYNKNYVINNKNTIGKYLLEQNLQNKEIKLYLKNKKITINGKIITNYNYELNVKDILVVNTSKSRFNILFEDKYLLIVDKPNNMLSINTDKSNYSLYTEMSNYVKIKSKNNKVFIVNRLDKETSGIVVFAKDKDTKLAMQNNWEKTIRKYIAVVIGKTDKTGVIKSYLKEDNNHFVKSSRDGKLSITEYKKIKENNIYTWLDINIKTGRKNQIRVHLNDIGCTIRGDRKYGAKKDKRMYLHAYKIVFNHPVTNKSIKIDSVIPSEFK